MKGILTRSVRNEPICRYCSLLTASSSSSTRHPPGDISSFLALSKSSFKTSSTNCSLLRTLLTSPACSRFYTVCSLKGGLLMNMLMLFLYPEVFLCTICILAYIDIASPWACWGLSNPKL